MGFVSQFSPQTRREAERLLRETRLTMGEIAARSGVSYSTVRNWNAALVPRARFWNRSGNEAPDLAALDAALRAHVARQIKAWDARLRAARKRDDAGEDTAKTLRDLGGLKRLLDDLEARARGRDEARSHAGPQRDLDALRESIARRYDEFAGERRDAALP